MPATNSELTSMKDPHAVEDMEGSLTNVPSSGPPTIVPSSTPFPTNMRPSLGSETVIENKAVSMASNDCSSALSSPAEASPAKPAVTSPTTLEGIVETSPATSQIASASDSLTYTGTSLVNISESLPLLSVLPSTSFGSPDPEKEFPAVLTFKGVSVTLENNSVWRQFNSCGTEMILTKQGRRMFPYCRYRLAGLDPERQYSLVLSIVPSDQYKYRWSTSKWEVTGPAEHQSQGLIRAFCHHYSPCRGSDWMGGLVSFYKLKLTNNSQDHEGHIILHSMHRYIPRLHVLPVPDGVVPTPDQPVVMGPESMTFTFPQTEFMAVTTYQNFRITQLKINHNPFAKGFREDGNNSRLNRVTTETRPVKTDTHPPVLKPTEPSESKTEVVDLSMKTHNTSASLPNEKETRLVLKPIMFTPSRKNEPYVRCGRGKHALGELVVVQKRPLVEAKEENHCVGVTPNMQKCTTVTPKATSLTPTSSMSTPGSSPGYRKRRKRINRRWVNSRGREWKATSASPTVVHSPSLTVAMQPELDDVEGLLFVSFTSKEALEIHVRDKPANTSSSVAPVSLTTPMQLKQTEKVIPETDEEKIVRLEAILLQDLKTLKHRQVIHPVLKEVGLKLSSLDPTKSIDLHYLGVHLPLPPPNLPEQGNDATAVCPSNEGLPFMSRTGKTSDMTKIKGWRNKFIRSKEKSASKCDGSQKNLSAFCSNMLDEYLESEAQQISERAAAFSTNPEGSVAYQLPAKSSSYVKTLDSVLKHRNAPSKVPLGTNRPCPLSHKPLLYSALTSPAPPLTRPTPVQAGAQITQQSTSSHSPPGPVLVVGANASSASQRLSTYHTAVNQKLAVTYGQSQGVTHRLSGLTKFQLKLLQMESGALNQGLNRTQLTPDRLSLALSVMLTKQMLPSQVLKVPQYPKYKAADPECGQDFCRLGCVCSSLHHPNRGPLHCRRPECMFGCACFKRKITKQLMSQESEQEIQSVYFMTNMENEVQPRPGFHTNKLWNCNILDVDPEPIFTPKSASLCLFPTKVLKRSSTPRPTQPIREEDKDPVYKYLESKMTCARVREFNSKPPPELTIPYTPNTTTLPQKTTDHLPKKYHRPVLTEKAAGKTASKETQARKQVEIQSACQWNKDRKMVLEALYRRMNQNRLSQRFCIGPYHIRPVTKIFMQKPSGSIVTYRVHISKPAKASDNDEDEFDDSDEEKNANKSFNGSIDAEEDDGQIEDQEMPFGVTPFLSGVLPAGRLRARTKPAGCQAFGHVQVNGKSYNQARLLLGNMGSLHPANRLAAYVTGRLHSPSDISYKVSQKPDSAHNTPGALYIKASGTVVPPIITARKTTDLKTPTQAPVQLLQPDSWKMGSITLPQHSQNSSAINPVQTFASGQCSTVNPFQKSSTSSPVSLTVSPSLKTPSFLGQSGTYSFRICPPANQSMRGQNLPGVTLPGGFTLIQLPKPGADGALTQRSETGNTTSMDSIRKAQPQKSSLFTFDRTAAYLDENRLGLDTFNGVKDLSSGRSVEPGMAPELMCDERMPSDESDEANSRLVVREVDSNMDIASEDLSSNSSDYCGEGEEDDEPVDIETVEEVRQGMAIAKMKEAASRALRGSRDSSDDLGSAMELNIQGQMDDEHDVSDDRRRRKNHTALERQRRSEQRTLFDKLQTILESDPRAPRLRLLSLALNEIQTLTATSKRLEEKKRRLTQVQSVYMKELSLLSGKSEQLIKQKLNEICERQKVRERTIKWKPFFSELLRTRAALLQATTHRPKLQPTPLLQPDFHTTPAQNNVHPMISKLQPELRRAQPQSNIPTSQSLSRAVSSPAQAEVAAPPQQAENHPGEPVTSAQVGQHQSKFESHEEAPADPAQVNTPNSQMESQAHSLIVKPQISAAQDKVSPLSSTPKSKKKPVHVPQRFTLPLIRSKTGRIILPSSLKPTGQGFYTLMVMKAKQKGKDSNVDAKVDSSKKQERSFTEHLSDTESSCTLEEDKTVQSSNSKPKHPGATTSLSELALLSKPIIVSSVALQPVESPDGGTVVGLSFNQIRTEPEPDSSPSVVRRRRGRPRKTPVTFMSENEKSPVVEDTSKNISESETSIMVEETSENGEESEKLTLEMTKTRAEYIPGVGGDKPVAVKRGRGRPPKKKLVQSWSPKVMQSGRILSKPNDDSPVRLPRSFKSPETKSKESPATDTLLGDINTSRPLTRGALGKDFPSAKKRSWIDIEKELEPELE